MIDDLLSLAGDAVAHARKLGADAVHAVAADGRSTEISILDGKIEKVEQSEARDISLKVYSGKSSATISGSVLTSDAIHRLAENALRMAKLAPPDPYAGLAEPDLLAKDIPDLDLAANDLPNAQGLERLARRSGSSGTCREGRYRNHPARGRPPPTVPSPSSCPTVSRKATGAPAWGFRCRPSPARAFPCSATTTMPPPSTSPTFARPKRWAARQASAP